MLREVVARQPRWERRRRWFSNEDFDLIVWFDDRGAIRAFELCYDRLDVERALTWNPARGYRHWRVDTGDASGMNPGMTPILEPDDTQFPKDRVIAAFVETANALEPTIRSFVVQRLQEVPGERTESEIVPGWRNDKQSPAWRPALIAAAIAIIVALAVWLFEK